MMRRTSPAFALAALVLLTPLATAAPAPPSLLPAPGMDAAVCHGPATGNAVCRAVIGTAVGAALLVAQLVDGALCFAGQCSAPVTDLVIFVIRNLPK